MINTILGMKLSGIVELVISIIVFYNIFVFGTLLIGSTIIAIYIKDWEELKKLIGWYFLVAFSILNAIAILGTIVAIGFQEEFVKNGVQIKSLLIVFAICFIVGLIFSKIGDNLIKSIDKEYHEENGTEKEVQKLVDMFGTLEWLKIKRNETLKKEIIRKLRNKEQIDIINIKKALY